MPCYKEKRVLPYTPEQLFSLVADVGRYPEFLPWILSTRLSDMSNHSSTFSSPTQFTADVDVGYKIVRESYRSRVLLTPFERIDIEYISGPFKHLHNYWAFKPQANNTVLVDFFIDFEFKSSMLHMVMQPLFSEAVSRLITAFETRAKNIYN